MVTIDIDREKKWMLLDWLKKGIIDVDELYELSSRVNLKREEIEADLYRLAPWIHDK